MQREPTSIETLPEAGQAIPLTSTGRADAIVADDQKSIVATELNGAGGGTRVPNDVGHSLANHPCEQGAVFRCHGSNIAADRQLHPGIGEHGSGGGELVAQLDRSEAGHGRTDLCESPTAHVLSFGQLRPGVHDLVGRVVDRSQHAVGHLRLQHDGREAVPQHSPQSP